MDTFELINKNRIEHGYTHKNLKQYKKYCNKNFKELKKTHEVLSIVYKLESNFVKFLLFDSPTYLYKNLRILKKVNTEFGSTYRRYITCFIDNKKDRLSVDTLVGLRHELADFYSFLDDIYCLCDNKHDFDQYKVQYQWHDITLLFETSKALDSFLDGTFDLNDHRFNTQIARKILEMERNKDEFIVSVQNSVVDIQHVHAASKKMFEGIGALDQFLDDNFLTSPYVKDLYRAISSVHGFVTKLLEYKSGIIHRDIDQYAVPAQFVEYSLCFESLKRSKMVDKQNLKNILVNILEKRLDLKVERTKLPFLPVFYDIAYDYVGYPGLDSDLSKTLQNFSLSNTNN